jgi:hypothetical protein
MVATIVLNQNNLLANGQNNTFVYNYPSSVAFPHHEVAVQSISMFYSWANISSVLGNNTFTLYFPVNAAGIASSGAAQLNTYVIPIPDGQYEVTDLNALIQFYCVKNGLYLINASGQNVYFVEMLINATRYAVQMNTFPLPSVTNFTYSAGTGIWTGTAGTPYAGWTTPIASVSGGISAFQGFPSTSTTLYNPALALPASFSTLLGFAANTQTLGASSSGVVSAAAPVIADLNQSGLNRSYLSTIAPQVQPNSSIYFSISNIENKYAIPNSIIYSLNPAVAFGEQIVEYPPQFAWNKLLNGTYNQIRLQILGLNFQPLAILDPNMTIVLVIRDTRDHGLTDMVNQIQGGKG